MWDVQVLLIVFSCCYMILKEIANLQNSCIAMTLQEYLKSSQMETWEVVAADNGF